MLPFLAIALAFISTQQAAQQFFGGVDPIGKRVRLWTFRHDSADNSPENDARPRAPVRHRFCYSHLPGTNSL
jgi:hypothetical protein